MKLSREIFLSMMLLGQLSAADKPALTVWKIEAVNQIGGHPTTVIGFPKPVEDSTVRALWFDGAKDGLLVPVNPIKGMEKFTIEMLICPDADGPEEQRFLHIQDEVGNRGLLELRMTSEGWALDSFLRSEVTKKQLPLLDRTKLHPAKRWTWVALVYEDERMAHYIDGVKELEGEVPFTPMGDGKVSIGVRQNLVSWFKGGIREVRFHSSALRREALQRTE